MQQGAAPPKPFRKLQPCCEPSQRRTMNSMNADEACAQLLITANTSSHQKKPEPRSLIHQPTDRSLQKPIRRVKHKHLHVQLNRHHTHL
ncbi:hypothetical protein Syncc9902_1449 [Synechococcus sp. CC9902]|nr:hypothetical protein Syncc9902_1449 [Synechococcus sp. CC9902]